MRRRLRAPTSQSSSAPAFGPGGEDLAIRRKRHRTYLGRRSASVASNSLVPRSHSFTVLSQLAEATILPSGEMAKRQMWLWCPVSTARSFPVATSHTRTLPSAEPDTNVFPSGVIARVDTASPLGPLRVRWRLRWQSRQR